jgi:hypothetical protein
MCAGPGEEIMGSNKGSWVAIKGGEACWYKTASIFPSVEYVDEKKDVMRNRVSPSERTVPAGPPVWRSQLMNIPSLNIVRVWPSGEKPSNGVREIGGDSKVLSCLRVTASMISTVAEMIAMNLLHGDHATSLMIPLRVAVTTGSHEVCNPCTTLAKGRAYCLYSPRTSDDWGDRGSAEI